MSIESDLARHARKLLRISRKPKTTNPIPFDSPIKEYPPAVAFPHVDVSLAERIGASPPEAYFGDSNWLQWRHWNGEDILEQLFFAATKLGAAQWLALLCDDSPHSNPALFLVNIPREDLQRLQRHINQVLSPP